MRELIERKVSRGASIVAGFVLVVGLASLAASQVIFQPHGPVLLETFGCVNPSDNVMRQLFRAECDERAANLGFQAGVVQPLTPNTSGFNTTLECPRGEQYWICAGVGGGQCTTFNCTILN